MESITSQLSPRHGVCIRQSIKLGERHLTKPTRRLASFLSYHENGIVDFFHWWNKGVSESKFIWNRWGSFRLLVCVYDT